MLGIIVSAILIALVLNIILKKFHLPTIIGYIFTGTIIAYVFNIHDAVNNHELKEIAEFGIVFLMFTIGLEFSIEHLVKMKREVFFTGHLQIVATAVIILSICMLFFGMDFKSAIIIGAALSLSSTAIVLKTFNDTKEINKRHGQRVLGILIMQDIAVIPILIMIGFFANSDQSILDMLIKTTTSALLLLALLFIFGKYLLDPFLSHVAKTNTDELFVASVLLMAIGASYLSHYFGFSYSLGAFLAGMLISETKFKHQVEADLIPFRNILLGVFFITVGMQINFRVIDEYLLWILILLPSILLIKYLVIYFVVKFDDTKRVAFKTALSLVQIGEFSLAILEITRTQNLIDNVVSQVLIVTIVISMIITPIILKNLSHAASKLIPEDVMIHCNQHIVDKDTKNHVIVLGYGHLGQEIVEELKKKNQEYVIIEHTIKYFLIGQEKNEPIFLGNAAQRHILEATNIHAARAVIVAVENPEKLHIICEVVDGLTHNSKTVVKVTKQEEKESLESLHLEHILVESEEMAKAIVKEALNA